MTGTPRARGTVLAVLAATVLLTACAPSGPEPELKPDPEPTFAGVVGQDWVMVPVDDGALDDVYWMGHGAGALWALRDEPERTDTLLTSTDAIFWTEVPLDIPDDLVRYPTPYVDDDRIVLAFGTAQPWIVIGDGTDWEILSPDDIADPAITGGTRVLFMGVFDIAPIGDSLLFLQGTRYDDAEFLPCHCRAPLVLHPDGSSEWVAVEGSPLGRADTFGGYTPAAAAIGDYRAFGHLIPTDDGILLVTSWSEGGGHQLRVLHSTDGLAWENRTPSDGNPEVSALTRLVGNDHGWVTATFVKDGLEATDPQRVVLLTSPDGVSWESTFSSDPDEYTGIRHLSATEDGFFAFPYPDFRDHDGADVLFSPDGVEWTRYANVLHLEHEVPALSDSLGVRAVSAIGQGLLVFTSEPDAPLWVSGATPYTPDTEAAASP